MRWLGGKTFTCLLTRFTTPEELFGPVSVAGLKEDRFRRITSGQLPEADGCFLDEVFKGSSAILNTLLRLLHERALAAAAAGLRARVAKLAPPEPTAAGCLALPRRAFDSADEVYGAGWRAD